MVPIAQRITAKGKQTMKKSSENTGYKSNSSWVVEKCQICDSSNLEPIVFLGYLPPVNKMNALGEKPKEQPSYPAQLLYCPTCNLAQLGLIVDPKILFPSEYPYTSSTTKVLRDNFVFKVK